MPRRIIKPRGNQIRLCAIVILFGRKMPRVGEPLLEHAAIAIAFLAALVIGAFEFGDGLIVLVLHQQILPLLVALQPVTA